MAHSAAAKQIDYPTLVVNRYRVEELLGSGGTAMVYRVYDTQADRFVALKQLKLRDDEKKRREIGKLFEQEYHILSQLSHPSVIDVYEYGKDDTSPYYTMELLEGDELREISPLPFQDACSLLLSVCSALSLLHSRRHLHMDLSPRNVHCTPDLQAKLIDFGIVSPMGPCKRVIGTPAFVSPEIVGLLDLDARSDLFSFGATLYYALTGKSPFPAQSFNQVRKMWRLPPLPPSTLVPDIPKELDQLVLSLIHLDPMARPKNAAVVMEKLSAISGIELDERLVFTQAYLSTPELIGRKEAISSFKKRVVRALSGRGRTISIEGVSGVGRSRFLNACILEGKLSGATILRADHSDAFKGNWGVARTLSLQLLDTSPESMSRIAEAHVRVLSSIVPELVSRRKDRCHRDFIQSIDNDSDEPSKSERQSLGGMSEIWARGYSKRPPVPESFRNISIRPMGDRQQREQLCTALCEWIKQTSCDTFLMVAIDDFHRIDKPSAAFIALLSQQIENHRIVITVTVDKESHCSYDGTLKILQERSKRIGLDNLSPKHTERLIGSIFGETSNLRLLANRFQTVSRGNPSIIMQLAQHLIDRSIARYQLGTWILPESIDTSDLPNSLNDALAHRIQKLSAETRELAQTMALSPEQSFTYDECLVLTAHRQKSQLLQSIDELIAAEIVATDNARVKLSHQGWCSAFAEQMDPADEQAYHLRLVALFEQRGDDDFRVAKHLLAAGRDQQALDRFIEFAEASRKLTLEDPAAFTQLFQILPGNWDDILWQAIQVARQQRRPRKQIYQLQIRLCGLAVGSETANLSHQLDLLEDLTRDSGLACYRELDSLPEQERLSQAIQLTQQRYDRSPESERGLTPIEAMRELARVLVQAGGIAGRSLELSFWDSVPSLRPFQPLSPAFEVVDKIMRLLDCATKGFAKEANDLASEIIERLEQPDRAGMRQTHHAKTLIHMMHTKGIYDAIMGLESALKWAERMEVDPLMKINAHRTRELYYVWQGDLRGVEDSRKRIETLQLQDINPPSYQWMTLYGKLVAYCLSDDLLGIKHNLDEVKSIAQRSPRWKAALYHIKGEYQRIRGNFSSALVALEESLRLTAPGTFTGWAGISGAYIKTLCALGRYQEAVQKGRKMLETAQRKELDYRCNYLRIPLAVAEARIGDFQDAVITAQFAVDSFTSLGSTGLNLGLAYESRALVASIMDHQEDFKHYKKLCAEQFRVGENPILTAKYERMMHEANSIILDGLVSASYEFGTCKDKGNNFTSQITSMFDSASSFKERAELSLKLLIQNSNSWGGYLYLLQTTDPVLAATEKMLPASATLDKQVKEHLSNEINGTKDVTMTHEESNLSSNFATQWSVQGQSSYELFPVILGHDTSKGYVITGLVLLASGSGSNFNFPSEIVEAVSKVLSDFGDVLSIYSTT